MSLSTFVSYEETMNALRLVSECLLAIHSYLLNDNIVQQTKQRDI